METDDYLPHLRRCIFIKLQCDVCETVCDEIDMYKVDQIANLGFIYRSDHPECNKIIESEINEFYTHSLVSPIGMFGDNYKPQKIKFQRHNRVSDPLINGQLVLTQAILDADELLVQVYFNDNGEKSKYTPLRNIIRNNVFLKPNLIFDEKINPSVRDRWISIVNSQFD